MCKDRVALFLSLIISLSLSAQVRPAEGAALNYRIIGFSGPEIKHNGHYTLQIAGGNYTNEDSFQKNVDISIIDPHSRIIGEVPDFGRMYTWRIVYSKPSGREGNSGLHHFSTRMVKWVDQDSVRLRIITAATAHKDDYVFMDGNKALYDMAGKPVWFMPKISLNDEERPRDIKITPFGTITTLLVDQVFEVNYDGTILWKGPGKGGLNKKMDSITNLHHHEITRLDNGNYMTFGFERAFFPLPSFSDSTIPPPLKDKIMRGSDDKYYQNILFGKLIEYDSTGKIVWQWLSSDYFKNSDLYERTFPEAYNMFNLDDTHANAFYFDERTKTICISFRNLDRVIKIAYPSGRVISTFGKKYVKGGGRTILQNGLFCGQHGCRLSQEGYLYVFNNNTCHPDRTPTVVMMRESAIKKDSMEKVWEFECPMDELTPKEKSVTIFNAGGNAIELPDRSVFCCMGSEYGKTLIVDRDKKILWCAQPEICKDNKWKQLFQYRGSMVTRDQLEHLIWGEHLKD